MQKLFIKRISLIIAIFTVILVTFIFYESKKEAISKMYATSELAMDYIYQMLNNNQKDIQTITKSTYSDYINKTESVAYILSKDLDMERDELHSIATYIGIDEINIFDENGVIILSTLLVNIGESVDKGEQISFFKPILENPSLRLVQEISPSSIDGRMMQYTGVSKRNGKGIVQIGMFPSRILQSLDKYSVSNVISSIQTGEGEEIFAVEIETGLVKGTTLEGYYDTNFYDMGLDKETALEYMNEENLKLYNNRGYFTIGKMGEYIIVTYYDRRNIINPIYGETTLIILCIIATAILLVVVIMALLHKYVVKGIRKIASDLTEITEGNLKTVIEVNNNSELRALSSGINTMVKHLLQTTATFSNALESLNINIGVYEYRYDMKHVFLTDRLIDILEINANKVQTLIEDKQEFERELQSYQKVIYENKKDKIIYCVSTLEGDKYIEMRSYSDSMSTIGIVIDVTEDVNNRNLIMKERDHDELTGLFNRKGFNLRVKELFLNPKQLKTVCVVMMDMDNLKYINDNFSHKYGDEYIKLGAAIMKRAAGECSLLARLGGDEFAMIFYGYDTQEEISKRINKMEEDMNHSFILLEGNKKQKLSFSAGYVFYPQLNESILELLHIADLTMYQVKKNGKGEFLKYDPDD